MAELIQGRSPLSLGAELREALQEYPSLWLRIDGDAPMGRRFPGAPGVSGVSVCLGIA